MTLWVVDDAGAARPVELMQLSVLAPSWVFGLVPKAGEGGAAGVAGRVVRLPTSGPGWAPIRWRPGLRRGVGRGPGSGATAPRTG